MGIRAEKKEAESSVWRRRDPRFIPAIALASGGRAGDPATVARSGTVDVTLDLIRVHAFDEDVTVAVDSGLTSGLTASFPGAPFGGATATVRFAADGAATIGTATVTLLCTSTSFPSGISIDVEVEVTA